MKRLWLWVVIAVCEAGLAANGLYQALHGPSDVETVPGWIFFVVGSGGAIATVAALVHEKRKARAA